MTGRAHKISLRGSTVHYWAYGPNKGAPVIVMIHGFRGTHHGLERIIGHVPGYTVIAPDLPGYGDSTPMDGPHDIDGYADLITEFIPKVTRPDEPVYLLGHSFGSIVAAKVAADSGLHFNGLVLVNPIARRPHVVGRLASIAYFALGGALSEKRARKYFSLPLAVNAMSLQLTKSYSRDTRRYVKAQHLEHFSKYATKRTLRESFNASVTHAASEYVDRITIPVLLIAGERDEIAPLKTQYAMYAQMTAPVELAVIERVGHLTHYEKPAEVADFIKAFIDR